MQNEISILTSYPSSIDSSPVDCSFVPTTLPEQTSKRFSDLFRKHYTISFEAISLNEKQRVCYNWETPPAVLNNNAFKLAMLFQQSRKLNAIPQSWVNEFGNKAIEEALEKLILTKFLRSEDECKSQLTESPVTLTAWLHITDRCNLRCSYCYLPHDKVDMSPEVGRSAIDATVRSAKMHGYKKVCLKYAGGEATLNLDLVWELHAYAQELVNVNGLELEGILLSNGTRISPKFIKKIKALGIALTISLDGLNEVNDSQRKFAGGKGSFDKVVSGIKTALAHGVIPNISITIGGRNVEELPQLIDWLLKKDLPFYMNFYRENDYSRSHEDLKLEETQIINGMQSVFDVIEQRLPQRSLLDALLDRSNLSVARLRSCGVGHSYMVFDYLGRVSKCQMQTDSPITTSQSPDPLSQIRKDKNGVQNVSVEEKEGCKDCNWKNWCSGGCPTMTFRATGRYDIKSPNCNIYKALFPAVIRLEGLRLLKYKDRLDDVCLK